MSFHATTRQPHPISFFEVNPDGRFTSNDRASAPLAGSFISLHRVKSA